MLTRGSGARHGAARGTRRRLLCALVLLATTATACDRVPLTAPTESSIQLFANGASVPLNGSVDIVATVVEQAGTPVQNGTVVTFTTTLGVVQPAEARTSSGKVTVKLSADGRSGTAVVTAFSGGATSDALELPIGAAAAETILVRAEPGGVPPGGGSVQVIAQVRDASGDPLSGVPETFTASSGELSPATAATNGSGEARTTLTTAAESTVTATAGGQSGEVTVGIGVLPTITLSASPTTPVTGQPVAFTVGVTLPPGSSPVQNVRISFGDGDSENLGAVTGTTTASHVYDDEGSYRVTVRVTDAAGEETSQSLVINVALGAPIAVNLTYTPEAPAVNQTVTFTAAVTLPGGVSAQRYDWTFGDGTSRTTTGNQTTKAYGSSGVKTVRVTVRGSDGTTGAAQADITVSP